MYMMLLLLPLLTDSTSAGVITAIATVITALGGLALALAVLLPILKGLRRLDGKVDTVHTIVNQQRTDAQRFNIALLKQLSEHGITPVVDQSLPVQGFPDAQPGQPHDDG